MPTPTRSSYVRELRHDFRYYYGVGYDSVETDEAVDLALSLPAGSAYLGALDPRMRWGNREQLLADLWDELSRMIQIYATRTTEGAVLHPRPGDAEARAADRARARKIRERIEHTRWEAV